MYEKNGIIFSEAGFMLKKKFTQCYSLEGSGDIEDYEEVKIDINNIKHVGDNIVIGNFLVIPNSMTYAQIKDFLIKKRYTVEDQIAILCNNDPSLGLTLGLDDYNEDEFMFKKMQEFRLFSAIVAKMVLQSELPTS